MFRYMTLVFGGPLLAATAFYLVTGLVYEDGGPGVWLVLRPAPDVILIADHRVGGLPGWMFPYLACAGLTICGWGVFIGHLIRHLLRRAFARRPVAVAGGD